MKRAKAAAEVSSRNPQLSPEEVTRIAGDAGMRVMRNEVQVIGGLQLAGLADFWSPEFGEGHGDPGAAGAQRGQTLLEGAHEQGVGRIPSDRRCEPLVQLDVHLSPRFIQENLPDGQS